MYYKSSEAMRKIQNRSKCMSSSEAWFENKSFKSTNWL